MSGCQSYVNFTLDSPYSRYLLMVSNVYFFVLVFSELDAKNAPPITTPKKIYTVCFALSCIFSLRTWSCIPRIYISIYMKLPFGSYLVPIWYRNLSDIDSRWNPPVSCCYFYHLPLGKNNFLTKYFLMKTLSGKIW